MAFTTWTALYAAMLDDLANGSWRVRSYQIGDKTMTYRSFADYKAALEYIRLKKAEEEGTFSSRVYAKQGGRGD